MRKIIQIATGQSYDTDSFETTMSLRALCDDGTVWFYKFNERIWRQFPEIPQPEIADLDK